MGQKLPVLIITADLHVPRHHVAPLLDTNPDGNAYPRCVAAAARVRATALPGLRQPLLELRISAVLVRLGGGYHLGPNGDRASLDPSTIATPLMSV